MVRIIYDVGSNNGDDLPYYLDKAERVIAIEANPALADEIRQNFSAAIEEERLIVENCVVTDKPAGGLVPFYICKGHHVLSQLDPPSDIDNFELTELPSRRLTDIIRQYGSPYYVKIDVENYDHVLLHDLFAQGIFPPYISAESHSIEVLAALVALGRYKAFKLVDGPSIPHLYANHRIATISGEKDYSFPDHSAGPFGNDVIGPWKSANGLFGDLARAGLGWKDIHASNVDHVDEG